MTRELIQYTDLLNDIKTRIRQGQARAVLAANAELIRLYWDIGCLIHERQHQEGWGAGVIPRLARDLKSEISEIKGFSERNIKLMVQFYRAYPGLFVIGQLSVAQLSDGKEQVEIGQDFERVQRLVAQLPWAHHVILMQKVKDLHVRQRYMQMAIDQGWSRDVLGLMIKSRAHEREGKIVSNFQGRLQT